MVNNIISKLNYLFLKFRYDPIPINPRPTTLSIRLLENKAELLENTFNHIIPPAKTRPQPLYRLKTLLDILLIKNNRISDNLNLTMIY